MLAIINGETTSTWYSLAQAAYALFCNGTVNRVHNAGEFLGFFSLLVYQVNNVMFFKAAQGRSSESGRYTDQQLSLRKPPMCHSPVITKKTLEAKNMAGSTGRLGYLSAVA